MKYRYNRITEKFWDDEKVIKWNSDTRLLAFYLLTTPHRNTEGLFRLQKKYMSADLNWEKPRLEKAFNKLLEDDFIKYDEEVQVVYIINAIKYQSPDNPNQEKSAIKKLKILPKTKLLDEFISETKKHSESFYKRLVEQFGKSRTRTRSQAHPQALKKYSSENFSKQSAPYKAASHLIDKITENNLRAKVPVKEPSDSRMQKWIKEMEKLHRLGPIGSVKDDNKGYSWSKIYKIIDWSQNNNFWKSNILSASKLREQIIKLENQMNQSIEENEDEISILQELYDEYEEEDLKEEKKVL